MAKRYTVSLITGAWKGELASFRTLDEAKAYARGLPRNGHYYYVKVWAYDGEWFVVRTIDL